MATNVSLALPVRPPLKNHRTLIFPSCQTTVSIYSVESEWVRDVICEVNSANVIECVSERMSGWVSERVIWCEWCYYMWMNLSKLSKLKWNVLSKVECVWVNSVWSLHATLVIWVYLSSQRMSIECNSIKKGIQRTFASKSSGTVACFIVCSIFAALACSPLNIELVPADGALAPPDTYAHTYIRTDIHANKHA